MPSALMTEQSGKTLTPLQKQRRERILQAVRDQLENTGYEGVSMRDLAEAARVSPTTLYNLFDSKDTLILNALTDLLDQLNQAAGQSQLTGLARILLNGDVVAKQIEDRPHYADAMARLLFNAAPDDPIVAVLLHNAVEGYRVVLHEMIGNGEISADTDVDLIARRLSTNNWALILLWMKGLVPIRDLGVEYRRGIVLTLLPVMTAKVSRQYLPEVLGEPLVASAS